MNVKKFTIKPKGTSFSGECNNPIQIGAYFNIRLGNLK